jgi:hypothetical protein
MKAAKRQLLMFLLGNLICPPGSAYAAGLHRRPLHATHNTPAVTERAAGRKIPGSENPSEPRRLAARLR